jgi:hypothetical protein
MRGWSDQIAAYLCQAIPFGFPRGRMPVMVRKQTQLGNMSADVLWRRFMIVRGALVTLDQRHEGVMRQEAHGRC